MKTYKITGMSCAACAVRIEKAVSALDGIESYNVSLLTNSMTVTGTASDESIISAITKIGYGAEPENAENAHSPAKNGKKQESDAVFLIKRFLLSIGFLAVLMYFSMGYTMWGFPLPPLFDEHPILVAIVQMLLALVVMVINRRFYIQAYKALSTRTGNMSVLVSLGSLSAFIYSFVKMLTMLGRTVPEQAHILHQMYFESAAMTLALITLGKALEAYSKGKTTNAIRALMDLTPKTATLLIDGKEVTVSASEVKVGDIFIVRAGGQIPTDGEVIEGQTSVNESALTGESMPVTKTQGSAVFAATINGTGFIKCRATKESDKTVLAEIIRTVREASSTKAPVQKVADKVSAIFVPSVIVIALITIASHLLFTDATFGMALERGVSVLLISCPCALGLATPVAIMVGSGVGARYGILFKNATALEETGKVKIVALDKTGTITSGTPAVTDILPYEISENELLELAYSAESRSEHPLSHAIVQRAKETGITAREVSDFEALSGLGIKAKLDNLTLYAGNERLIGGVCEIPRGELDKAKALSSCGKTPLFFAGEKYLGIIAVADTVKPDSVQAISELNAMGLKTVMITGDNEITARAVAEQVGISEVVSDVLPTEKGEAIKKLSTQGRVAMVGDGINDAPALTSAHIGIAIGNGSDIAIDSADVVLAKSSLSDAVTAIKLSKRTLFNIKENLFWAFFYNAVCIPLAAGAFGLEMKPMYGALAMSLSSFFVVINALRLNLFKTRKKVSNKITVNVQGMMCEHCENAVREALLALAQVKDAKPSHKKSEVKITLKTTDVPIFEIEQAIVNAGYKIGRTEKK